MARARAPSDAANALRTSFVLDQVVRYVVRYVVRARARVLVRESERASERARERERESPPLSLLSVECGVKRRVERDAWRGA